jgi:ATP-binding cassette subfamily C (CFTR/MRP) protein 10
VAFVQVRAFSFASGGLVAAQRLHKRLLAAVAAAPTAFSGATPAGRILNRFSSDTATADDSLPFILNILLAVLFSMLGVVAVLTYTQPLLAAAFIPLALIYRWLQVCLACQLQQEELLVIRAFFGSCTISTHLFLLASRM